jgi:inosose dehydratase
MSHRDFTTGRRTFLGLGAAAAAGAVLAPSLFGADARADADAELASSSSAGSREYGGLPMGIQTYTLRSLSFDRMLDTVEKTLKLKYVEIFPGHHAGISPQQVKEKLAQHGLTASAYGVVPFKKDPAANRKFFELGKDLAIKALSCDPDPDAFDTLDKQVEEFGIAAAIHPHGPGHRWAETQKIFNAVKDHHKLIGLCNDTGHLIRAEQDPVEACHVFKDRLYGVHFKDFKKAGEKFEDCVLGDGLLDVDAITKTLIGMKFQGALSLEYEGGQPVEASLKCLQRVKQAAVKARPA